jgi:hypothetical protein
MEKKPAMTKLVNCPLKYLRLLGTVQSTENPLINKWILEWGTQVPNWEDSHKAIDAQGRMQKTPTMQLVLR